jgi:hypothetical protein
LIIGVIAFLKGLLIAFEAEFNKREVMLRKREKVAEYRVRILSLQKV